MTHGLALQESETLRTLKALKDLKFVVIGGYAANAYALPRFSIDCDIVVKAVERKIIQSSLLRLGYRLEASSPEAPYCGSFFRYKKLSGGGLAVSMDILVNKVTDRMTGAVFSADWVFEHSRMRLLRGKTVSEALELSIINLDALLVMKITACRPTDIRDVFMMLPNAKDAAWIKSEVAARCSFNDRISKIIEKVNSKQFKDGLSGVHGKLDKTTFDKHNRAVLSMQG